MVGIKKVVAALATLGLMASGSAQAELFERSGGMIYDNVLNITWLKDANYAQTSGYDSDGLMNWYAAEAWAAALNYGGYSDWRLPTVKPMMGDSFNHAFSNNGTSDLGYAITSPNSEMAYMYYVNLENLGYCQPLSGGTLHMCFAQSGWGLTNTGPFDNLQDSGYWSGAHYNNSVGSDRAWLFDAGSGNQKGEYKTGQYRAWAVRPGDVAAVPEPGSVMLIGLALAGLAAVRWRPFGAS